MKTVCACLFLLLLLTLTPGDHQATAAVPGPKGCYDPADYGAKPNDDIDDRGPAQQALDDASTTGGRVCFGAGVWTLTRAPVGSYNRFAALSTHGQHVEISGEGPSTVLRIGGDQGGGATSVISLDPGASDIRLRDFVIDTSGMINTDEQTHAIAIGSGVCTSANGTCSMPVVDVSVERIRFVHPGLAGFRKGDCIRLLGNTAATEVLRTTISGNPFTDCARSDGGVQRNVNSLTIIGNHFASPHVDQHIDGEASGGEGDKRIEIIGIYMESPQDVTIAHNSMQFPTPTANTIGVKLLANKRPIDRVMIAHNRLVGALYAGVLLDASPHPFVDVTLIGNQVRGSNVGIRCEGPGGFQPIISVGNKWGAKECAATMITGE